MYQYGALPGRTAKVVVLLGVVVAAPPGLPGAYHRSTVSTLVVLAVMTPYAIGADVVTTMWPTNALATHGVPVAVSVVVVVVPEAVPV
jgi:hypothetical protein